MKDLIKELIEAIKGIEGTRSRTDQAGHSEEHSDRIVSIIKDLRERVVFFRSFEDEELADLALCMDVVRYPAGVTVFNEGERGDSVGFVTLGKFVVMKRLGMKGDPVTVAVLSRDSIAGEFSMVAGVSRTATIVATEESEALVLKRDALEGLLERHPDTGIKALKAMIRAVSIRHTFTAEDRSH